VQVYNLFIYLLFYLKNKTNQKNTF